MTVPPAPGPMHSAVFCRASTGLAPGIQNARLRPDKYPPGALNSAGRVNLCLPPGDADPLNSLDEPSCGFFPRRCAAGRKGGFSRALCAGHAPGASIEDAIFSPENKMIAVASIIC